MDDEFSITLPGVYKGQAQSLLDELAGELRLCDLSVRTVRDDSTTQDLGTVLMLTLGAPATIIAARALLAWVQKKNVATLRIEDGNRALVASGMESHDVAALAKAFQQSIESRKP